MFLHEGTDLTAFAVRRFCAAAPAEIYLCKQYRRNLAGYGFNPEPDPGGFLLPRFHAVL